MSLLDFFYPPTCFHCQTGGKTPLCNTCLDLLEPLKAEGRCNRCFAPFDHGCSVVCQRCRKKRSSAYQTAAVFDNQGPITSLYHALHRGGQWRLKTVMGSFLVAQLIALDWPTPDLIVPVPEPFTHRLRYGYRTTHLLAQMCAKLLKRPSKSALSCSLSEIPRIRLRTRRLKMHSPNNVPPKLSFFPGEEAQPKAKAAQQTILLVEGKLGDGLRLQRSAQTLRNAFPLRVYGLALMR